MLTQTLWLIRPHLEYACTVWDPFLQKDIQLLEKVQKFAAKVCTKQWHWSYQELLHTVQLPSLQVRRKRIELVLLYKYISNMAYFTEHHLCNVNCTIQLVHHIAIICIILVGILANTSLPFFPNQYVCGMNYLPPFHVVTPSLLLNAVYVNILS